MPLFLRISATDWLENEQGLDSWKVEDTVRLTEILADKGVDLLDVSSGGLHPSQEFKTGPGYQAVSHLCESKLSYNKILTFVPPLALCQSCQGETR